jgi:glycine C-acetyltransferase
MSLTKIEKVLSPMLNELAAKGLSKGRETVVTNIIRPRGEKGPRYLIEGYGDKEFIRMNSNSYLGMSIREDVIDAAEKATRELGVGPGAVRFISGTYKPHVELERRLAQFHKREAAMLFSSAYATMMALISVLVSSDTVVISDELNHNCIINAVRLARPKDKKVYKHNDMKALESVLKDCDGIFNRCIVITDGVFSMRGDYAPLQDIVQLAFRYECEFEEGILTVVDDSHGVGAIGATGRGTTEVTQENKIDILVATLGKAFGSNGGYLVSDAVIIHYLKETAPFYIYSNPISVADASAAIKALQILDTNAGKGILKHLHEMVAYFRKGLTDLGYEVIPGIHPVVPLMLRDTQITVDLVNHLKSNGILATGLSYPVVPRGSEEIRFQVCADHTKYDLDCVLKVLQKYRKSS